MQGMLADPKVKQESGGDMEALYVAVPPKATLELVPKPPKTMLSVALHGDAGDLESRDGGESSAAVLYADLEEGEDAETDHLIQVRTCLTATTVGASRHSMAATLDQCGQPHLPI